MPGRLSRVLFLHVAPDRGPVVVGIRLGGTDLVDVDVHQVRDQGGHHGGVADGEVDPTAVVVVLARPGEERHQRLSARAGA